MAPAKEPLVLIHGFSGTPVMWEPVAPLLAERFELHVVTLVGHCGGPSLPDGVQASASAIADDLERQMDELGLETAHLCGNSLGGWMALELASRGRARSVVALAPAGGWEQGSREEKRLARLFKRQYRMTRFAGPRAERFVRRPGMRRFAMRDACVHGDRFTAEQAAAIIRGSYDCPIYLDFIEAAQRDGPPTFVPADVPVRIVWGTRDRILPHGRYSQKVRDQLPAAEYVELDGLGHVPMVDDPEAIARMVAEVTARAPVTA